MEDGYKSQGMNKKIRMLHKPDHGAHPNRCKPLTFYKTGTKKKAG
jgi:hypothetical protein